MTETFDDAVADASARENSLGTVSPDAAFVVASDLKVDPVGAPALEDAFRDRLGEVEQHEGFQRLEVWRDNRADGSYLMITWWDDEQAFRTYMRSIEHKTSHERIPTHPAKARGVGLRRFTRIAT
jgi:heme-degrading monooxygenase HmoA